MSNLNPTVVIAHLEDEELKQSIANLVAHVKRGMHTMITDTNSTIDAMEKKIKSLGDIKIDSIGTINGGFAKSKSSRSAKEQTEEVKAVKESTQAYKEKVVALDQVAEAQQKAARGLTDKSRRYQDDILRTDFNKLLKMPEENLEQMQRKVETITTRLTTLRDIGVLTPNKIQMADQMVSRLQQEASTIQKTNNLEQQRASLEQRIATLTEQRTAIGKSGYQAQENLKALSAQLKTQEEQRANVAQRIKDIETQTADAEQRKNNAQQLWIQTGNEVVSQKQKLRELNSEIQRQEEKIAQQRKEGGILTSIERTTGGLARVARSMGGGELSGIVAEEEKLNNLKKERAALEAKIAQLQERTQDATKKTHVAAEAALKTRKDNEQTLLSLNSQLDRIDKSIAETKRKQAEESAKKKAMEQSYLSISEQINSVEQKLESTTNRQVEKKSAELQTEKQITQEKEKQEQITRQGKEYKAPTTSPAFAKMVASTLGLKSSDIETDAQKIQRLNVYLNQLQQTWNRLTPSMQNSNFGRMLREEFQSMSRYVQQLRKDLSTPISLKAALGGSEKTLDDIAYKIQRLQSYRSGLNIKTQTNEIDQVNAALERLKKKQDEVIGKNQSLMSSNQALARSWNYMKNRLAFYFTVGASTQFVKNLIEVRSQYEMNERALGILIDSAERGTQIFNELSQMALVSPYTLIELSSAAKQLSAYDVAARDLVDTTRRLADLSAAVGIPVERLTTALGQIKAFEHLTSLTARRFASAGIPLVKQLADYYTELKGRMVSVADVYDMMKKKQIGYNDVMQVIYRMTDEGGKFFDFQAKMADTLKVRLANLTLAWNNMLNDIGKESQGLLTWGIGALRTLFLHWRQLDTAIKNVAWIVGIRTAIMLLIYSIQRGMFALGALNQHMALSAVFGKKLAGVIRTLAASLKAIATSKWTWIGLGVYALWEMIETFATADSATKEFNKTLIDGAKTTLDELKKFSEQYKELRDSLYKNEEYSFVDPGGIERTRVRTVEQDIDKGEASKAWEAMREQIELASNSSQTYIQQLVSIDNVSERLRQGFALVDDLQAVNAALAEMDDKTITINKDFSKWWNLWLLPDGLIENLSDLNSESRKVASTYGDLNSAVAKFNRGEGSAQFKSDLDRYSKALETFREDLQDTTDSIIDFIELKGWSGDINKINEIFSKTAKKLIEENQLNPEDAFLLQTEFEEARSKAARDALARRLNDLKAAYTKETDEQAKEEIKKEWYAQRQIYIDWNDFNGRKKVEWERFTKWLKEQHISETTAMFRDMDAEDIRSLNFQEGAHAEWVKRMVTQYAKEHKMSYDEAFGYLRNWVTSANQWSIFIPMTISTDDKKSVYEQLGEYDKIIDDADAKIKRLTTRINELKNKSTRNKNETKELADAEEQLAQAEKDKADAEAKGGHGKQEAKNEKKAAKERKQAESELQKALKEELSLIDKVRSTYKTLTKEGVDSTTALTTAISGYDETVRAINSRLSRFGIAPLDLSKYAGVQNPREIMNMLQAQLNQLIKSGAAKPSEIKDLQVKLKDLKVDSLTFDHKTITDSLNNELSKLKDEYELAVELDANPELGNIFTDIFDIDPNELPQNLDEYAARVTDALNKSFEKEKKSFRLPTIELTNDDLKAYKAESEKAQGLITEADYNKIEKLTKDIRNLRQKDRTETLKRTQELQYKLGDINEKIAIESKKLANLQVQYEREKNEEKKKLLELEIKDQEQAISQLKEQILSELPAYKALFESITDYSNGVVNRLAKNYKRVLDEAKKRGLNNNGKYTLTEGDVTVELTPERLNKEYKNVFKEIRKSESAFAKIKNAFTGNKETNTQKDWAKGLELIAEEARKAADGVRTVAEIFDALGGDEDTTEILNDVATSMEGIATAGQGVSQIASGDYIGGTVNVIKGAWEAISTWFDNDNKKIDRQIEKSKFKVQELELAYKKLEYAAKKALGTEETSAKRESIAVKEQELAELERQLALEQQKDYKKDSDEREQKERIQDYLDSIESLKQEIQDAKEEIVNNLLGGDVKSAAEEFVDTWVEAWRAGETTLDAIEEKMDEMIFNLIKKAMTSKIVENLLSPFYKEVNRMTSAESENGDALTTNELRQLAQMAGVTAEKINTALGEFYGNLDALDIISQSSEANKQLSALQQGIQGITEDTAGALEGITNGISQQVYLHSQLLTEIRNAVVSMDNDIQMGIQAQMLLQLQQSYAVQMAIQNILLGWSNPSGMAVKVEMI